MKRAIYALVLLAVMAGVSLAQEETRTAAIYGGFTQIDREGANARGLDVSGQLRVYGKQVRLEGVGIGTYLFPEVAGDRDLISIYRGGPQVSVDVLDGKLTLFGRLTFGATVYDGDSVYTHAVGGGGDVNLSRRVFIRVSYEKVNTDGAPSVFQGSAGIGIRFF